MAIEPKKINYDVALKSTNHTTKAYTLPPEVYTSDAASVQFRFNILDVLEPEFVEGAATYSIEITSRDGSIFQDDLDITRDGTVIEYMLKENQGNHAGLAKIQLLVTLGTMTFTSGEYEFKIINNIANAVPVEIYVQNWGTLTSQAEAYITQMAQDIESFDVALETGVLATNIEAKLMELSTTFAPDLTTLKADMVQAKADIILNNRGLGTTYATLVALQTAFPSGDTYDHIVSANGHRYFWNASAWTDGGIYQAIEVADKGVTRVKLADEVESLIDEVWVEDAVEYAIVDAKGLVALSVDATGKTKIHELELPDKSLDEAVMQGVEILDDDITGVAWGVIDSDGRISDLAIGTDGKILPEILSAWKIQMGIGDTISEDYVDAKIENDTRPIDAWGDSLTGGAAGLSAAQLWVRLLASGTGRVVNNMGVGGEDSATISMRQGGSHAIVNNITIPAATTPVLIAEKSTAPLKDNWGKSVYPIIQQQAGVNPITIAGISGTMTITDPKLSTAKWYFTRSVAGSEVIIDRPTAIITNASKNNRNNLMIIFMGQNGGYSDNGELIQQIQRMIDFNRAIKKEYLVFGFTTGTAAERAELDGLMSHAFGRRFVNIREYMVNYGLADSGITPTQADLDFIALGKVPPSLLATSLGGSNTGDYVHYGPAGHVAIAKVAKQRMVELAYI